MLSMEKAGPIFVILPLAFYFVFVRKWKSFLLLLGVLMLRVSAISFLALGGNSDTGFGGQESELIVPEGMPIQEARGVPGRFSSYDFYQQKKTGKKFLDKYAIDNRLVFVLNRIIWIPYVTAYDWLGFHRNVLNGELTMGRSIGFVHLLFGDPKVSLEKMVYVYQYGPSPGREGASNTVFLVDAKLAFGWVGVVFYSLLLRARQGVVERRVHAGCSGFPAQRYRVGRICLPACLLGLFCLSDLAFAYWTRRDARSVGGCSVACRFFHRDCFGLALLGRLQHPELVIVDDRAGNAF